MSADTAIRLAYEAGLRISRDGENLVLRASNPPAVELVTLLRLHKPAIIARLKAESVKPESAGGPKPCDVRPIEARGQDETPTEIKAMKSVTLLTLAGANEASIHFQSTQGTESDSEPSPLHMPMCVQSKGGKGGEPGDSESHVGGRIEVLSQTDDPDPNPDLPRPLPGETLLPGWGTRVSMEYRLRTASEDECLEWAREPWQLKLVAKARGYAEDWARRIARNRMMWTGVLAKTHQHKETQPSRGNLI